MNYGIFIIITIIQAILTLTHWFLYKSLVFFYNPTSTAILWSLRAGIGILSITFLVATIIIHNSDETGWQYFYEAAAGWLGILHWLVLASVVAWIIYIISLYFGINLTGKIYYSILLGLGLIMSIYGFYNAFNIRVTKLNIALPNLPPVWQGTTIAFASDLHLGAIYGESFASLVVKTINAAKPAIILIGGDVYDSAKVNLEKIISPFREFSAPQGIYFITGNHEEFGDNNPYLKALKTTNVTVLDNKMVNLNGLQIAG
ncbi:MAG: metallophosphoesterase [Candidatus Kerfeldbacteria bacterium]|nr:metallophosphoesterase [Candidatus Kerfeldbacteria bacterium]